MREQPHEAFERMLTESGARVVDVTPKPSVRCYDCAGPSGGKLVCGPCLLLTQLKSAGITATREYKFAPPRRWRADLFLQPDLLIEVDGGVWTGGRHSRGTGQINDFEKGNAATMLGYRVLHYTVQQVSDGTAAAQIQEAMQRREP